MLAMAGKRWLASGGWQAVAGKRWLAWLQADAGKRRERRLQGCPHRSHIG
jgi:hypothetical protein